MKLSRTKNISIDSDRKLSEMLLVLLSYRQHKALRKVRLRITKHLPYVDTPPSTPFHPLPA